MIIKYRNNVSSHDISRVIVVDADGIQNFGKMSPTLDRPENLILFSGYAHMPQIKASMLRQASAFTHAPVRGRIFESDTTIKEMVDHILTAYVAMYLQKRPKLSEVEWTFVSKDKSSKCTQEIARQMGVKLISVIESLEEVGCPKVIEEGELNPPAPAVAFKSEVDIEALTTPIGFEGPMGLPMPNMMSRIGLFINENGGKPAFGIDPDKSLEKQLTAMGYLVETVYTTGPVRVISWPK